MRYQSHLFIECLLGVGVALLCLALVSNKSSGEPTEVFVVDVRVVASKKKDPVDIGLYAVLRNGKTIGPGESTKPPDPYARIGPNESVGERFRGRFDRGAVEPADMLMVILGDLRWRSEHRIEVELRVAGGSASSEKRTFELSAERPVLKLSLHDLANRKLSMILPTR